MTTTTTNGNGAAQVAPAPVPLSGLAPLPTGAEAPASVTVKLRHRGHDVMLTLRDATGRDVLQRLDAALTFLEQQGALPAGGGSDPAAPVCPTHGKPMQPSQYGGWFCPAKIADDDGNGDPVYCRHKSPGGAKR